MKPTTILFLLVLSIAAFAGVKKKTAPPTMINPSGFAGLPVGATKAQCAAKGFTCKDEHIGDYLVIMECRKHMEFAGTLVEGYTQMNRAGTKSESVGFDTFFPGDKIHDAQNQFYAFEKEVEAELATKPEVISMPDTYLAMTNFKFAKTKTIVSCYLYSDDRTKPPRLRCGAEVRSTK